VRSKDKSYLKIWDGVAIP